MREIKFRGKHQDGLWEYGSLMFEHERYYILGTDANWWEVIPETIGQFTGLLDKNGKEIYEGDYIIVNGETPLYTEHTTIKSQEVFFENGAFWCAWSDGIDTYGGDTLLADVQTKNIEIIGNIHEGE